MHLFRKELVFKKNVNKISIGVDQTLNDIKQGEPDILKKIIQCLKRVVCKQEVHATVFFVKDDGRYCNCLTAKLLMLRKCSENYIIYRQNFILSLSKEDTIYGILNEQKEYIF